MSNQDSESIQTLSIHGAEKAEAIFKAMKKAYLDSLYNLSYHLLRYRDLNYETHLGIINLLEDTTCKRKLICVPRGCFKSSLCVVSYAIWRLMKDPNIRILIDSELYTNSKKFLREIKDHLQDSEFVRVFGETKGKVWKEDEIIIKQRTKTKKEGSITCGGVGTIKVGQHYDLIIGDDYNSNKNSNTDEGRKKIISHYKYNLSILEQNGEYVLIGTRYSMDDLIGWIIQNEVGIKDFRQQQDLFNQGLKRKNGVFYYE